MQLPQDLIISISGVRGKNPGSLTPEVTYNLTLAFCKSIRHGAIVLSRDSRPSGKELKEAIIKALTKEKRKILDADLIPLPTTQLAVEKYKAAGAIDITASHNPIEWNGLKFLGSNAQFIQQETLDNILKEYKKITDPTIENNVKNKPHIEDINKAVCDYHIEKLKKYFIKGRKLTVAVDAVNGSGSIIVPKLLKELGCDILPIATNPQEPFPHTPEPTPANLEWTQKQLKDKIYDLCVVVDPDADRLVLIDSHGHLLNEEVTAPLVVQELIGQGRTGNVVINMSTSRMIEDLSKTENFKVIRSKVGEINVVNSMVENNAFFGAEGNGGIIDPEIHYGRDSLVGITFVINLMRWTGQSLDKLVSNLPHYEMAKDKIVLPPNTNISQIYDKIEKRFSGETINKIDGLRLDWEKQWIHIRPSNTEPIVRIIAESPTKENTLGLIDLAKKVILG
jgi:phosphomannomutase